MTASEAGQRTGMTRTAARRYLLTHDAGEVLAHLEMAARLGKDPVQLNLRRGRHSMTATPVFLSGISKSFPRRDCWR